MKDKIDLDLAKIRSIINIMSPVIDESEDERIIQFWVLCDTMEEILDDIEENFVILNREEVNNKEATTDEQ